MRAWYSLALGEVSTEDFVKLKASGCPMRAESEDSRFEKRIDDARGKGTCWSDNYKPDGKLSAGSYDRLAVICIEREIAR